MKYIVTTLAAGAAMREALGRAYATETGQPYPIVAFFLNGSPNLDPTTWAYWYSDPKLSADSTAYAFSLDVADFPNGTVEGQTIATGFGDVTIPTAVELAAEWFPAPDPGPGG